MGDKSFAPSRRSASAGFDAFNHHGSSLRVNSEVALQAALREIHRPDHVTWVKAEDCDILGFAEAGHAKAHLSDGDDAYIAIRKYQIPARSLDDPEGSVDDRVLFARWEYEWNGRTVPCYKFRWVDEAWAPREYYAFVTDASSDQLSVDAVRLLTDVIAALSVEERTDPGLLRETIRVELRRFFKRRSGRRPLVMPVVLEI